MLLAEGLQVISPPQYSVAWIILAVLCIVTVVAAVVDALAITRAVVERAAYRGRPHAVHTQKAEFLRTVNAVGRRFDEGNVDARQAHLELAAVLRSFVRRTTGLDVTSQDVGALLGDPRTRAVGELISDLYEPEFAITSDREVPNSLHRAREVIRAWS